MRLVAVTATAVLALSFLLFAVDQSEEGSATQVGAVEGSKTEVASEGAVDRPAPEREVEKLREASHGGLREAIDDANDPLVTPFTGLSDSHGVWVERIATTGPALLLYGLGGMLLASFLPKSTRRPADWREATE